MRVATSYSHRKTLRTLPRRSQRYIISNLYVFLIYSKRYINLFVG